ncbi:MAG TPA: DUF4831 family protein [Salinivirgaceae bacterium]|nr:DUF4831 family protein [Salinivirgaceae bacterium]
MKNTLFICIGIITLSIAISCKSETKLAKPYIIPYSEVKEAPLFLYNLPATTIAMDVKVKQTQSFKGPYSSYATKFLGLDNKSIIKRNSIHYEIVDIQFTQFPTPDSSQWYAYMNDPSIIPNFSLSQENVLTSFNAISDSIKNPPYPNVLNPTQVELDGSFRDLGVIKIESEEIQTVYRHIKSDTTIIKVPVQETVRSLKSIEDMARHVSDFIIKIRNHRYELVAGLYEAFPEGESLKASIEEMYSVENRYTNLFTGVNIDTTYTFKFLFTPQGNSITPILKTLCYFDAETGVTLISPNQQYSNDNINQHLRLEIEYANYHPITNQRVSSGGPVYRIPALCEVKVLLGEETLSTKLLSINQLGNILQLPIDVLNNSNYKVEIDRKTGNLKSITTESSYDTKNKKDSKKK